MKFADRLAEHVTAKNSCILLGLDPSIEKMPTKYPKSPDGILDFCINLIDQTEKYIVGIKPQLAYFEIWGSAGIAVLEKINDYARSKNLIIIADGKRGDIGSTSAAYAEAFLGDGPLRADACTVNPFLGTDGISPFIEFCEKNDRGIFVLVRTSNPSAIEIQGGEGEVSVTVANMVEDLGLSTISEKNFFHSVGAVVGATLDPQFIKFWREEMPHAWFLCPGVGAQGGNIEDVLAVRKEGLGVLIPASRSIMYAEDPTSAVLELWEAQKI